MDSAKVAEIVLKVNGDDVNRKMKDLQKRLEHAKAAKDALYQANKGILKWSDEDVKHLQELEKEINTCTSRLGRMQLTGKGVKKVLDTLDKSTLRDLNRSLRTMKAALSQVERGSEEWNTLTAAIKKTKEEIKKANAEHDAFSQNEKGLAALGKRWVGFTTVVQQAYAAARSVINAIGGYVEKYADMEERMADVRKYTGLSTETVRELNEEFKKMDTRTSREGLNALAADAGRLGIQGKEAVLEFVEAADIINIALGEDLGEDAIKNIGKLAQLFGDSDRMGLRGAMLATASTINDLGQTSSASEAYIVEFAGRLANAGSLAGMTQAQVMALGAVLDQSMINVEQGATALQKVINKIYSEPQKMAKAAGLDVKAFTELVKKDANAALLQFAQAVSNLGGMDKIAPMLGDINMTGAGVSTTIAALANNIDLVRQTQEQATKSFADGNSALNEFNVANNTVQARLEKSKKDMAELSQELGERLTPLYLYGMNVMKMFASVLITLIRFIGENARSIIYITSVLAAYTVAVNASVIADKAKVFWTNTVMASLKKLYAVLLAHPWAAVAAVVAGFVVYMQRATAGTDSLTAAAKRLKKVTDEASASIKGEKETMESLLAVARDETRSKEERETAIRKLNDLSPEYLGNLSLETINTDAAAAATRRYVSALLLKKKIEMAQQDIHELEKSKVNAGTEAYDGNMLQKSGEGLMVAYSKFTQFAARNGLYMGGFHSDYATEFKNRAKNLANSYQLQIDSLQESIDTWTQELVSVETAAAAPLSTRSGRTGTVGGNSGTVGANTDPVADALKQLKERAEVERITLQMEYEKGLIDRKQYEAKMLLIGHNFNRDAAALYAEGSKERLKYTLDDQQAISKQRRAWSLRDLEVQEQEETAAAKRRYANGELSEKQYQEELTRIRLAALKDRLDYEMAFGSQETQQSAEKAYDEAVLADQMARRKQFMQEIDALEKQYLEKSSDERLAEELRLVDELARIAGWSEEEIEKMKEGIRRKYRQKEKTQPLQMPGSMDALTSSFVNLIDLFGQLEQRKKAGEAGWQDYAAVAVASIGVVSAALNSASQLMQANFQLEASRITRRYAAEIEAAGNNRKKVEKLEKQRDKELRKMEKEQAKKMVVVQVAQAVAQGAMAAINAYASAAAIPMVGWKIAPIAAAMALVATGIQIAAIKKQAEAQQAVYYEGGFTGGSHYRREAGVVHEGEFVANHLAVQNPNIAPVLRLIDHAQRTNTVASLTAADVSRAVSAPQITAAAAAQPTRVSVSESPATRDTLRRLSETLDSGIDARVLITGEGGFDEQWTRYQRMKSRR